MRIVLRSLLVVLIAVLSVVGVSCGGASNEEKVADTLTTYLDALANGDGQEACDQLTGAQNRRILEGAVSFLPELASTSCADALTKLGEGIGADERELLNDAEIVNVEVDGDSATAQIDGGTGTAELEKPGDRWLISGGIGIEP